MVNTEKAKRRSYDGSLRLIPPTQPSRATVAVVGRDTESVSPPSGTLRKGSRPKMIDIRRKTAQDLRQDIGLGPGLP
ncbi:hypothetical protein HDU88_001650 [Geranomyces variabilis]|nr:hypothetical protein HDU88_001650 [Geranomyces variabilis]